MKRLAMMVLSALLLSGCAVKRNIAAYQAWATRTCEQHHTAEQCKPLSYPSEVR
jgi:uncharacterized lipoprotein YmbA